MSDFGATWLSAELSSRSFGRDTSMSPATLEGIRAVRNDANSVLDPRVTLVVLRVLSNLALTGDNQRCLADHPGLLAYLVEVARRRDAVPSDCCFAEESAEYSSVHVAAMRVVAHVSGKVCLSKWVGRHVASRQPVRYKAQVPASQLHFDDAAWRGHDEGFVRRLVKVLARNLALSQVMDRDEVRHGMLLYSLMTCCHLAANPNNHGVLSEFVRHERDEADTGEYDFSQ